MGRGTVAVADAGPLIHLDELGALELLAMFERVLVPEEVGQEVKRHRTGFTLPASVSSELRAVDSSAIAADHPHLQQGEISALALCSECAVALLLTDDLATRDAARALGVTPVGSLGSSSAPHAPDS